jgi:glycosyltransferase involved in cell wall biosynthesis
VRPLRVVLVVGAMDRGGIENWLMGVARALDPRDVELVFVAHHDEGSHHDPEIRRLGHRVVVCRDPHDPVGYARRFARVLEDLGPVDAVHSFVATYSAVPLGVARWRRVRVRVAHSQTDRRRVVADAGPARRAYTRGMSLAVRRAMTHGLACTDGAARFLFGRGPGEDARIEVLPNGIDLEPFATSDGDAGLRRELGLEPQTVLVGHVGRFVPVKNQAFLLDVAAVWQESAAPVHLVLVGDGPDREGIAERAARTGLGGRVTFTGARDDIPSVMTSLDALVLPSRWEGSPITLVEAQAAGLPCVVSPAVSRESEVVPGLLRWAPDGDAEAWCDAVLEAVREPRPGRDEAQRAMAGTAWSLPVVVDRLCAIWSGDSRVGGARA